jgi:hypothetical protein
MVTTLKVETLNKSERPATFSIIYNWWHTYWNKTCLKICVTSSHIGNYFSTLSYIHYVRIFSFASDNQISHQQATPNLKAISLPTYCLQLVNLLLSRNTMHFDVSHNLSIIIFASQGLRFGSPFSPPFADLEYILKFVRNAP